MLDVVIPYINGPKDGFELRMALRSIEENLVAPYGFQITIIGQLPLWCKNVRHVPTELLAGPMAKAKDSIRKMKLAAELCPNGFIYTYDDVYLVQPTALHEVQQRHHVTDLRGVDIDARWPETDIQWRTGLKRSCHLLRQKGLDVLNHETHSPRWFEPISVKWVIEEYNLEQTPALLPTLYYNSVRPEVKSRLLLPIDRYKTVIPRTATAAWLNNVARQTKVLNHRNQHLTPIIKAWLENRFRHKSSFEI